MTDNRTDSQPNTSKTQGGQAATPKAQTPAKTTNSQTAAQSPASDESTAANTQTKKSAEPQIRKVDIAIAGVTYPIFCPAHEEEELQTAVYHINEFAMGLKKDAPRLSQENLLVLCCLNLYEKIHHNQKQDNERVQQDQQTAALLNKIMKDAQSIL